MSEGFRFITRGRFQDREAFSKFGHAHQRIVQERGPYSRCVGIRAIGGDFESGQLILHFAGPIPRSRADLSQHGFQSCSVSGLCGNAREFQFGGEIVRLRCENLLDQLFIISIAIGAALALHFFSKLVSGAVVAGVNLDRLPPIRQGRCRISPVALEKPKKLINVIVVGRQATGLLQSLSGDIQFPLAQCQHSPVRPTRRFSRHQSSQLGEFAVGVNVVAHLESAKPNIKRGNGLRILLRRLIRKSVAIATGRQTNRKSKTEKKVLERMSDVR